MAISGSSNTTAAKPSVHEHVFNDDLLTNPHDIEYATSGFPEILHVLDYPRLRDKFAEYEKEANLARDRVRALGFTAVISALLALVVVATRPLWPHFSWTRWIAIVIELDGMLAALIAAGGLWLGPWKRRWLESRLMTERKLETAGFTGEMLDMKETSLSYHMARVDKAILTYNNNETMLEKFVRWIKPGFKVMNSVLGSLSTIPGVEVGKEFKEHLESAYEVVETGQVG